MYPTKYTKAASIDDVLAALAAGEDAKLLAGGQTLLATMKQHLAAPSDLIDVRAIDGMSGVTTDGDTLVIGAATTHADVAGNADVQRLCPALASLAGGIGDPAVRYAGTIGGSIANNDPAADYPAGLLALGATIVTNTREIAADDFFEGLFTTALDEGEIITAVRVTAPAKAAYMKFRQPASLFALVGVCVADGAGGTRVAVTGAGEDGVFRHEGLEAALSGNWAAAATEGVSVDSDGLMSDMHGSADYRANLIKVLAKRAVDAS
ncbi:xanthine dehydrogenase family protein subunit M [Aliiroseovarius sp. F20344]|uniref:FAD binding domain-containing protein n=1 Tax=Aliiroseovarius sp. F20344 TaxID=2926414 RepID=UPI001FF3970B|nr:xanthine dehydrogenase family protein subunit M [Aliiroseovarius sp. F20344]MCK0141982.1 xanthine dehydrogenase family protein subunit M [Aliiroseovarius sp. F20344]